MSPHDRDVDVFPDPPDRFRRGVGIVRFAVATVLICLVRFYQVGISPLLIGTCKFCPSCSEYFIEAVEVHGPWKGGLLGARRLVRCHPFAPGGIDPVPPRD
jgi:putative membrane protein insertion efficiency factor